MQQTEKTAIVLRAVNYRENDRMLTLFSPTKGRLEASARGCRKPRSPLLAASEVFALGDYSFYAKAGRLTVTGVSLIESFYPLRADYDRMTVGVYLLGLCEAAVQPNQPDQELFMLLLHTLSRLTFYDHPWRPLLTGFLCRFAAAEGFKPRLQHCVRCGKRLEEGEALAFDRREGGAVCAGCALRGDEALTEPEMRFLRDALVNSSARWLADEAHQPPLNLMRRYVEERLDRPLKSAAMLPE